MTDPGLIHVVDDDESVRRSLTFLLRPAGYRVETWADGSSFLAGVDRFSAACVLLDIRMPGVDGLEVLAAMAAAGLNFPVIVLTGHGNIALAVRAIQAGACDFLEKPVDRDTVLSSVALAFRKIADVKFQRERTLWAQVQIAKLTQREAEVLDGLACGYPNKTIAYDLGISARTVEVYRANIMSKLEVRFFADALRIAFSAGLGAETKWRRAHGAD